MKGDHLIERREDSFYLPTSLCRAICKLFSRCSCAKPEYASLWPQDSPEMDKKGNPKGYFPYSRHTFDSSFPVIITTPMSADRAHTMLQFLHDGIFIDAYTMSLAVQIFAYNAMLNTYGYASVRMTWKNEGSITAISSVSDLPIVPWGPAFDYRYSFVFNPHSLT